MYRDLISKNCFIFDMDGTVYLEDKLINGAHELFNYLESNQKKYFFLTNNSSRSVEQYVDKLTRLGIKVEKENIITSTLSTITYIKKNYNINEQYFYIIGTEAMIKEFLKEGIKVVTEKSKDIRDVIVVVGFDTTLNYEKLKDATYYLRRNPKIIATNCDFVCPLANGEIAPDCASIVSLLKKVIDCEVIYCGKPSEEILSPLYENGFRKDEMVIIGDRLYTDVALGNNSNIVSIIVETGEFKRVNYDITGEYKPTYILESIFELFSILKNNTKSVVNI